MDNLTTNTLSSVLYKKAKISKSNLFDKAKSV